MLTYDENGKIIETDDLPVASPFNVAASRVKNSVKRNKYYRPLEELSEDEQLALIKKAENPNLNNSDNLPTTEIQPKPILDKLFGLNGVERYQFWPEKMVRSGSTLPGDVMSGALPVTDPETGRTSQVLIERTQDLAGLAGGGGLMTGGVEGPALAAGAVRRIGPKGTSAFRRKGEFNEPTSYEEAFFNEMFPQVGKGFDSSKHGMGYWLNKKFNEKANLESRMTDDQLAKFKEKYGETLDVPSEEAIVKEFGALKTTPEILKEKRQAEADDFMSWYNANKDSLRADTGYVGKGISAIANTNRGPFLRPALKYEGKIYKAPEGGQHLDALPKDLQLTFHEMALKGDDITNFKFGFMDHKGRFLSREKALEYAINEGIMDQDFAKFGTLTSTMYNDNKMGTGVAAMQNAPMFYSAVEKAVANAKQPTATAEQWLGYLRNQPGVKPEELEWTGLSNLPKGQITKDQLAKHITDNKVEVEDVMRGSLNQYKNLSDVDKDKILADYENAHYGNTPRHLGLVENWYNNEVLPTIEGSNPTKYSAYTLPGANNYREVLMTLPQQSKEKFIQEYKNKTGVDISNSTDEQIARLRQKAEGLISDTQYKSSHWDEPNVLAHIRMNDREIPNVGKTLHVEEIQSDWHQAGRKQGYKGDRTIKELPQGYKIEKPDPNYPNAYELVEPNGNRLERFFANNEKEANDLAIQRLNDYYSPKVPNAPFKKTWDELALKRVLREAAEKDYDAVSWTPGEAQAARYDLSKQVSKVDLVKDYKDGNTYLQAFDHSRNMVIDKQIKNAEKELPELIGKEAAEKLLSKEDTGNGIKRLEGLDLKVGGEGMKAFYDKMLVDKVNTIAKKFGMKVEQGNIPKISKASQFGVEDGLPIYQNDKGTVSKGTQPIHVLRLTPEFKKSVLEKGFPLFSAPIPVTTPVSENPFERKYDHNKHLNWRNNK
jgi:hypothetical protein